MVRFSETVSIYESTQRYNTILQNNLDNLTVIKNN
jgi:hypothetical protein